MLRRINKRGSAGDLVSLSVATVLIAAILIGFVVISGIVKTFSDEKNGEKIYKKAEVGVGDLRYSMMDYRRLILAEIKIREGVGVDEALELVNYGDRPDPVDLDYYGVYYGGFYGP